MEPLDILHYPHPIASSVAKRRSAQVLTARQSFTARHPSMQQFTQTTSSLRASTGSKLNRMQVQSQIKRRYQRMIELQHKSFVERHELEKEREQFLKKSQEKIQARTKQLREQIKCLGQSSKELQFKNRIEGAQQRQQKILNDRLRLQRQNNDLEQKKKAASQRHRSFRVENRMKRVVVDEPDRKSGLDWPQF